MAMSFIAAMSKYFGRKEGQSLTEFRDELAKLTADNYFDAAQGLYWFCAEYHTGQNSRLYHVVSTLDYTPGAAETSDNMTDDARTFYEALIQHELDPIELRNAVWAVQDGVTPVAVGYAPVRK